ncbi:hypothetical protein QJQ58_15665 [Paenibacillus dendritiformis]|uniref:hypothetical protein n=1 Tax=Paenibacillus dendritiformis TaxID=130049 RepID=UPI00248AB3C0|nr:hypothetical protein [Paenibacillus dendritiformis]WGU92049.1 hypothetical protein QJQ58_15665 [Paenibacillus dendritiformis]
MERLLSSSGLCKALQYTEPNFLDRPDVVDPSELIMEKIFPYLRVPGTEEEASTYILLQLRNYRPTKKGGVFKSGIINIYAITHKDLIVTDYGMLRHDYMVTEIEKLMNNQRGIGIGKLEFFQMDDVAFINNEYIGNVLSYKPYEWN